MRRAGRIVAGTIDRVLAAVRPKVTTAELDAVAEPARVVFDHVQARITFSADVFWTKASIGEEALALWLDTYQTSRDLRRRGIVEVSDL